MCECDECVIKRKKYALFRIALDDKLAKWRKINDRFATNDSPAGCKLTATGCMDRFNHSRDEERMDKVKTQRLIEGSNIEAWKESNRLNEITEDMDLDEIMSILNPEEVLPWEES